MLDATVEIRLQAMTPPLVHGVARLASLLYAGSSFGDLLDLIGPEPSPDLVGNGVHAAWLMDRSWAFSLNFSPYQAAHLQQAALSRQLVFQIRSASAEAGSLRLLALAAPGDLMVNAPLDFLTEPTGVRLEIAYLGPSLQLPACLPDHDVAIVAASESAPDTLAVFARWFGAWPRPILNDPAGILPLSRPRLPHFIAGRPGLLTAPCCEISREELADSPAPFPFPFLLRPLGSHAGHGLVRIDTAQDLASLLAASDDALFTLTGFIDYRSADGWYRKYRIAFVDGQPFVCHMAASDHWMVHYLNAGMDTDPAKRRDEAMAMAGFDRFARRHAAGLDGIAAAIGLDYFSVDCAEAPDGRLLVFEVDTAAIIHSMDDPVLYPYKRATMQRCYDAFGTMLRGRCRR